MEKIRKSDGGRPLADKDIELEPGRSTVGRGIRWDPEVLKAVDELAKEERRNRSSMVNLLIDTHPKIQKRRKVA
jgi:hypothetical protein